MHVQGKSGIRVSLTLNTGRQARINSTGHSVCYMLHLPDDCIFMQMVELEKILILKTLMEASLHPIQLQRQ